MGSGGCHRQEGQERRELMACVEGQGWWAEVAGISQ